MEIIYLVFLVFSGGSLDAIHMESWHNYANGPKYLLNRPCEEAIEDPSFQKHLRQRLSTGQKGRLVCKTMSEMQTMKQLVGYSGVEILPAKADSKKNAALVLEGSLIHKPYEKGRRSVESYLGQEFFLKKPDGTTVALYPGESVSREQLLSKKGQKLRLKAKFVDRTPKPEPGVPMSYPMGPDGGPLPRVGYEVLELLTN